MTPWESGLIRAAVLVWALAFLIDLVAAIFPRRRRWARLGWYLALGGFVLALFSMTVVNAVFSGFHRFF